MASVRAKAALGATTVVAVALVTAGLVMLVMLRGNLDEQVRLQARVIGTDVAGRLATGTAFADLDLGSAEPVQVLDREGRVLAVSDELEGIDGTPSERVVPEEAPPRPPEGGPEVPGGGSDGDSDGDAEDAEDAEDDEDDDGDDDEADGRPEGTRPAEVDDRIGYTTGRALVDGQEAEYLFAVVEVTTPYGENAVVYAGAPLGIEQAAVESVRTSMLVGVPLLLAVVGGVTWLVTRRALGPVEGIRGEMAAITRSEDLSRRVPEPATRDEIGRLARTTNETLAALESSVERQRRFVADASHELRSPIASLRTQLEVGEAHPELLDVPGAVKDTVRLQDLAADLLLLARLDAGERPLAGRVPLAGLVAEELDRRRPRDRHPVTATAVEEVTVSGSRGQLVRVLGNLLDNAQRHADGAVRVSLRREGGTAVLEVADDGSGVPEADRERIFERFVRLDDARSREDGGAGLGLAIARDVAARHGGTLTVHAAPEGGALFALRLPAEGEEEPNGA
jgi:signal transduction histidine kinase